MIDRLYSLDPTTKAIVQMRIDSQINFIKNIPKQNILDRMLGLEHPASSVIKSMRAELSCWGINNV